jgi:hypothetical protein
MSAGVAQDVDVDECSMGVEQVVVPIDKFDIY